MKEILDEQLAKNKNAKYFIFGDKPSPKPPLHEIALDPERVRKMVRLGSDVVPEAEFYCEAMWLLPGQDASQTGSQKPRHGTESHTHDFGELIGFFGFNYDDVHNLGAEVEFWIDGKQQIINETFVAFIPPGVKHGPLSIRKIVRPLMHLTAGPIKK